MKIAVGSTNPVKINAVITAASETWPDVLVKGFDVSSGVDDQPRSDKETMTGAINRAKGALEEILRLSGSLQTTRDAQDGKTDIPSLSVLSKNSDDQVLGVGLEGGVFTNEEGELWSTVWAAVIDQDGFFFTANGARCKVPEPIADLIQQGQEMGPVVDKFVKGGSVRQKEGMIGVITKGFVDRTEEYRAIAKFALGLWYGKDWDKFDRKS